MSYEIVLQCPWCVGAGSSYALACGPVGSMFGPRACELCQGSGRVSAAQAAALAEGARFRRARIKADATLGDVARRYGLSPAQVSTYERTGQLDAIHLRQMEALRERWERE